MISIIIPTYKRQQSLDQLLHTIANQNLSKEQYEVFVADNFFDRKTKDLVESHKILSRLDVNYLYSDKKGVNIARNLGLSHSRGEIFVFLDDDCLLRDKSYLARVIELHKSMPTIKGIGGRYVLEEPFSISDLTYQISSNNWLSSNKIDENLSYQLIGGNMSYKRDVFDQGLLFNEKIIFGGAELEFNERAVQHGHALVLVDNLEVVHKSDLSHSSLFKKAYLQGFFQARHCLSPNYHTPLLTQKGANNEISKVMGDTNFDWYTRLGVQITSLLQKIAFQGGVRHAHFAENDTPPSSVAMFFNSLFAAIYMLAGTAANELPFLDPRRLLWKTEHLYWMVKGQLWKFKKIKWYSDNNLWKVKKIKPYLTRPYHYCKMNAWKLKMPFWHLASGIKKGISKSYHFFKLHLWKLKMPFWHLASGISKSYHFFKLHLWKLKMPFWFVATRAKKIVLLPFRGIKKYTWRINLLKYHINVRLKNASWKIKLLYFRTLAHLKFYTCYPYHFIKSHIWRIGLLPHFIRAHAWRIKLIPHILKRNLWKLKMPVWFIIKFFGVFLKPRQKNERHKSYPQVIADRLDNYTNYVSEILWT